MYVDVCVRVLRRNNENPIRVMLTTKEVGEI